MRSPPAISLHPLSCSCFYTRYFSALGIFGGSMRNEMLAASMSDTSPPPTQCNIPDGVATPTLVFAMSPEDADMNDKYRPFLLDVKTMKTDWISQLELDTVISMVRDDLSRTGKRVRILILYGSLTKRYN
jgi:hypothetical protein